MEESGWHSPAQGAFTIRCVMPVCTAVKQVSVITRQAPHR